MARLRDRLRTPRGGAPPDPDEPAPELIVLDAIEEVDAVDVGILVEAVPRPGAASRALRRERRTLVRRHEVATADLGGLLVEMARRGSFNHPLAERRAFEVVEIERRIAELDGQIAAATDLRRSHVPMPSLPPAPAHVPAAHAACARCSAAFQGDANFCPYCGAPREEP
jgi:hypothetical protein